MKFLKLTSVAVLALMATSAYAQAARDEFTAFEEREYVPFQLGDQNGAAREANGPTSSRVLASFQGVSQYDVAAFGRNFIPPDTMGAVGTTQYTEFVNGGFAVFSKNGGIQVKQSDIAFWTAAGQTSANGDSRVMFNKAANRWVALSFGASVADIQIAVSNTDNAAGAWTSTKFTGYAGGTADYPTLAMDTNAIYIGTNNFNGDGSFGGTTLNVIPIASIFGGATPTAAGLKQFVTPYNSVTNAGTDGGYAIQGVNSSTVGANGMVEAVSLFTPAIGTSTIVGAGTAGATRSAFTYVAGVGGYDGNDAARQPNAIPDVGANSTFTSNDRVIDTLDDRIGSSVYEVNGRIYSVHTVTPTGTDFTVVRWDVVDAATNTLLAEGDIGDATHDYWEGSLAVNEYGQVVIGYNRSGSGADGLVSFLARVFSTDASGHLTQRGQEELLKVSLVDDYHNGSLDGRVAVGRQRWGDYSAVSLDPTNDRDFWVVGEYAREYNDTAGGHTGGSGGSRWSTWISELGVGTTVPEPAAWLMMITGFGLVGSALRRRRSDAVTA